MSEKNDFFKSIRETKEFDKAIEVEGCEYQMS